MTTPDPQQDSTWRQDDGGQWWKWNGQQWVPHSPPRSAEDLAKDAAFKRKFYLGAGVVIGILAVVAIGVSIFGPDREPPRANSDQTVREMLIEQGQVVSPTYDSAQEAEIREGVAEISPAHDNRKTIDWARATCRDVREGKSDESVLRNITLRWTGGYNDAPELSTAEARELLAFLRPYCA